MGSVFSLCLRGNGAGDLHPAPVAYDTSTSVRSQDLKKIITFKDFKGFKEVDDIMLHYKFYDTLGKGSFGEVKKGENIKGEYKCAIKIVKKAAISKHKILVDLMHNELKVLEETVRNRFILILSL